MAAATGRPAGRSARLSLLATLLAMALSVATPGWAVHNGGTGLEDSDVAGCHCHNEFSDPDVTLNLMGLPERYTPDEVYELTVTVAGGPPATETSLNVGGFMLSCTNGSLAVPPGSDLVQIFNDDRSASHTMAGNDYRQWTVLWKAPKEGTGDAVFHMSANTVNGDGIETGELDAYNLMRTISFGEAQIEAEAEGVSEWGVPISAYWLGVISFAATLVLTWAAYYMIKGTSRHHLVHAGRRRRYQVEMGEPPSSFGAALAITVLTIVEVVAALLLARNMLTDATDEGLAINLAVVLALFLVILGIYRSAFVPRLVGIEPEEGESGSGGG